MTTRYNKDYSGDNDSAANDFFASENDNETMSQTASTDDSSNVRSIVANETSDFYIGIGHLKAVASAFLKAHPAMDTNWSGLSEREMSPQLRYVKALHEVKGDLGQRQREAEGNVAIGFGSEDWYAGAFGSELPTIETEAIDGGILSTLEAQEGKATDDDGDETWPEGSTAELGNGLPVLLPVLGGEVMPCFVSSEAQLGAALEQLEELPEESGVAPVEEEESEAPAEGAETANAFFGEEEESVELGPEAGITELTVGEVRDMVTEIHTVEEAEAYITAEQQNESYEGGRKQALKALRSRRNKLAKNEGSQESEEAEAAPESGEEKAALVNRLIDGGMDAGEAIEQVRNL
ncbi:hypothetical protein [Halomonas sp.]|uniref:hypothetical protein n=1 Tax=Halomonas sp. TaxID=1486246 RepID=UPI003563EDB0